MPLISLLKIDNFDRVRDVRPRMLSDSAVAAVKEFDEADEIEPWIQAIFYDTNRTPHGPSELVDILTHKTTVRGREGVGAFILDQIAKINMITIQSLIRNLPIFADARVDYLIIDEFRHAATKSYRVAIDAL